MKPAKPRKPIEFEEGLRDWECCYCSKPIKIKWPKDAFSVSARCEDCRNEELAESKGKRR